MDEVSRYVVGLDVGTENVRAVVATVNKDKKLITYFTILNTYGCF